LSTKDLNSREKYVGTAESWSISLLYCIDVKILLMETDQEGDGGGRRDNLKERMPEKGTEPTE
jgi:hypothetical protein